MCGIAGFTDEKTFPAPELLLQISNALRLRGPDGEGFYCDGNLALIHRRLAVIDLAGGVQPMQTEDGRYVMVYNGEIFNYRELRKGLEGQGMRFRTNSDTEVLLQLYRRKGADCVNDLNGFFAFAVYDKTEKTLFLARDPMGVKPLFYYQNGKSFAFASNLNALKGMPFTRMDSYDPQTIAEYMAFQYVPGNRTCYKNVCSLPPGYCLFRSEDGNTQTTQYFMAERDLPCAPQDYEDAEKMLREKMLDSVRRRLISDVPLGVFLSGGLDSAIIAALAAQECGRELNCFSISFPDAAYDESVLARESAEFLLKVKKLPVKLITKQVNPCDWNTLRFLAKQCGEPFADASILPAYLLSRMTREYVTVALSGDGADELFGGYDRYRAMNLFRILPLPRSLAGMLMNLIPAASGERSSAGRLRRFLMLASLPPEQRYRALMTHGADKSNRKCCLFVPEIPADGYIPRLQDRNWEYAERDMHQYLPGDVLRKVDTASMSCGLEVRTPFLDKEIVRFALSLPSAWKLDGAKRKRILGDAFRNDLVPGLPERKKRGFGVPVSAWLRGPWKNQLKETVLSGILDDLFRRTAVETLISEHETGKQDHGYYLFSLLMLALSRS